MWSTTAVLDRRRGIGCCYSGCCGSSRGVSIEGQRDGSGGLHSGRFANRQQSINSASRRDIPIVLRDFKAEEKNQMWYLGMNNATAKKDSLMILGCLIRIGPCCRPRFQSLNGPGTAPSGRVVLALVNAGRQARIINLVRR